MTGENLGKIMLHEQAEPESIWGKIITLGSLVLVYGPRGAGKSFFVAKMIHALTSLTRFLKWCPTRQTSVVLFDGEMPRSAIAKRFWSIQGTDDKFSTRVHLVNYNDCGGVLWNLSNPSHQPLYDRAIAPYDVVIIDNLLTATYPINGRDDDVAQWLRIQPFLVRLRDQGKAVVLVHHTAKSGVQYGSILKENTVDTIIRLRPNPSELGLDFDLLFEKHRHFWGQDAEALNVNATTDDAGSMYWTWRPLVEDLDRRVIELSDAGLTPKQISDQMKLPMKQISMVLKEGRYENNAI